MVATDCACANNSCQVGQLGCSCGHTTTSICEQCVDIGCPCVSCLSSSPAICTRCTSVRDEARQWCICTESRVPSCTCPNCTCKQLSEEERERIRRERPQSLKI